jgi:hypothetical protein
MTGMILLERKGFQRTFWILVLGNEGHDKFCDAIRYGGLSWW